MKKHQLRWHLQNNVMPRLTENTINNILGTYKKFQEGKLQLTDPITSGTDCTVGEMFEDLKIEV